MLVHMSSLVEIAFPSYQLCFCVHLQNLNHSEFILTWGSEFPDKLKIRKEIKLWPLRFKLRADYSRLNRSFEYGCSCKVLHTREQCPMLLPNFTLCVDVAGRLRCVVCCEWCMPCVTQLHLAVSNIHYIAQDALLGGRIRVNVPLQEVEYRSAQCRRA